MKKILVVGYVPYGYNKKLAEAYPDVISFYDRDINYTGAVSLVELVGMFDGVMFMDSNGDNLAWEVACIMKNVRTLSKNEYPVEKKQGGKNEQLGFE